jgi:hypothetical protein
MGEQKMPNPNQNQADQNQPGKRNPQQERESASRQPGKQAPGQEPRDRASNPSRDDEAARRQSKQDPLQNRDR